MAVPADPQGVPQLSSEGGDSLACVLHVHLTDDWLVVCAAQLCLGLKFWSQVSNPSLDLRQKTSPGGNCACMILMISHTSALHDFGRQ